MMNHSPALRPAAGQPAHSLAGSATAILAMLAALSGAPGEGMAQEAPADTAPAETFEAPAPEYLAPPLLDQLLAPIALYPDALLSQILMASTYPLEVIEAYRWVSDPANAGLTGAALEAALESQDWDPSVKSLVPFPDILKIMNDKLGWMQDVGNAFLSQQQDVMDSVQRLRNQAAAAGNLQSNAQQRVVTERETIIIQPARTEVVYVPYYDPLVVYGPWLWPAYPPFYFAPFPRHGIEIGFFHWFNFGVISLYWGWNWFDWHHHHVHIDRDRYNRFRSHHGHPPYRGDTWQHDPYHRRGVAYVDPRFTGKYRPNPHGTPASRADHRGFEPTVARTDKPVAPAPTKTPPTRTQETVTPKPSSTPGKPSTPERPTRDRTVADTRTQPGDATRPGRPAIPSGDAATTQRPGSDDRMRPTPGTEPRPAVQPPAGTARVTPTPPAERTPGTRPSGVTEPRPSAGSRDTLSRWGTTRTETRTPPAFENYTSGAAVRADVARGRSSRQSQPAPEMPASRPDRSERTGPGNQPRRPR